MSDEAWEKWYNRILGLVVPAFLGYLLVKDAQDGSVDSDALVVAVAGYGAGVARIAIRKLAGGGRDDDRA